MTDHLPVEILPAQRNDIPSLQRVAIETQVDTFGPFNTEENMAAFVRDAYSTEQFERELVEPGSIYYLAWSGGDLAGFARLRITDEAREHLGDSAIELHRLYVRQKFHGQKIGKMLMERALDHARANHREWIWLGVWEHNRKAQEFYAKWGFTRFADHIFMVGNDPQHDWLMKRKV